MTDQDHRPPVIAYGKRGATDIRRVRSITADYNPSRMNHLDLGGADALVSRVAWRHRTFVAYTRHECALPLRKHD
jgi:hypothetical protein